jgi:hypothetical protein
MPLLVLLPARSSLDCAVYVLRDAGMAGGSPERGCAEWSEKEELVSLSTFAAELVFLYLFYR